MEMVIRTRPTLIGQAIMIVILVFLLPAFPAQAAEKFWMGESGWWDVPSNWDPPEVPNAWDDVYLSQLDSLLRIVKYKTPYPNAILHSLTISTSEIGYTNGGGLISCLRIVMTTP